MQYYIDYAYTDNDAIYIYISRGDPLSLSLSKRIIILIIMGTNKKNKCVFVVVCVEKK